MKVSIITNYRDINIDESTWNSLVSVNQTNTVFQTFQWFNAWWQTFGSDYELVFVIVKDHGKICAFVPLMIGTDINQMKVLRFACDTNSDYNDFVINNKHYLTCYEIINELQSSNIGYDYVHLKNIPAQSTTTACLNDLIKNKGCPIRVKRSNKISSLLVKNHIEQAEKIIKKYSVKRHLNKTQREGEVSFRHINLNDQKQVDFHLTDFFDQHINRYKFKKQFSIFQTTTGKNFYHNLIKNMSKTHWIKFSVMEFDNKPISYHFGFDYAGVSIWYKPSFDIEYKQYSPGVLLIKFLIETAIEKNNVEFDFSIGDESYKQRFSNRTKYNNDIYIFRNRGIYLKMLTKKVIRGLLKIRWIVSKN